MEIIDGKPVNVDVAGRDFKYYIFDWDDNILHMPTRIYLEHRADDEDEWRPVSVSTGTFALVRTDAAHYRMPRDGGREAAFRDFQDAPDAAVADLAFIRDTRAALARIFSILDVHMELPERADAVRKPSFDDRIVFDDVSFRYETADRDAVSHASFEIARGRVVAVVGGTGSGKSTMSGLLARFYDPREGRITMDGVDLRDLHVADLRALVGSVMQETLLFNDTIEENIKYGSPDATHEQIVAAAKMANAHDFIMAQPEGYARNVGEKGFALSGGERQRIAIARAILRNPPILILDEATSALDTVTERLVQDAIDNLMKDRTTFAIAHRLSTIRNADLILVMQGGRIVERGTHAELFAANGVYRKLCDMQKTN